MSGIARDSGRERPPIGLGCMQFFIGVDSQTGLTRSAVLTAAPVHDQAHDQPALTNLRHGNKLRARLPIYYNWIESQIQPVAMVRSNWLFAG